jgi:uncharacterized protein DUF2800
MTHALLAPSSASRWLACTPSARLEKTFPDHTSEAAAEGTLAHKLAELFLLYRLKRIKRYAYEHQYAQIKTDELYDAPMTEYIDEYADYVIEQYNAALAKTPVAQILLEHRVDLSDFVPEGYGTIDVRIIADRVLRVIDLKYGKGVMVTAINNMQLRLYALGALRDCDFLYDIDTVELTIYQPRLDSVTTETIAVKELKEWAENELKPRAALAFEGSGEYVPGDHCRFCKARGACAANAAKNLAIQSHSETPAHLLSPEAVANILDRSDELKKWLTAVESYALDQATSHGKQWPGYKLVAGRSNRKYANEAIIITGLETGGFKVDEVAPRKLLSITNLEKKIGPEAFRTIAAPNITKPDGAPTLAPLSDKRAMFDVNAQAAAYFQ